MTYILEHTKYYSISIRSALAVVCGSGSTPGKRHTTLAFVFFARLRELMSCTIQLSLQVLYCKFLKIASCVSMALFDQTCEIVHNQLFSFLMQNVHSKSPI